MLPSGFSSANVKGREVADEKLPWCDLMDPDFSMANTGFLKWSVDS